MYRIVFFIAAAFLFLTQSSHATTWDEPWQDSVICKADFFVLAEIGHVNKHKGVKLKILKTLAGGELKGTIKVDNFYLLDLCSYSGGHGPEFYFPKGKSYFFLKKNSGNTYSIATPSAGFDYVEKNSVYATYRITQHKSIVPVDVYEQTMTALFNHYHSKSFDLNYIHNFITTQLSKKPAGHNQDEISEFFLQHAALECIYHLKLPGYYERILPFLYNTSNYHIQISAARALASCNTDDCKITLMNFIADSVQAPFTQTICVYSLAYMKPAALKAELVLLKEKASNARGDFGESLMDPRICTSMPSPKEALANLLRTL